MTVFQFPDLHSRPPALATVPPLRLRVLAPLKRESDIFKVMPYLQGLSVKVAVEVVFIHVSPARLPGQDHGVDALLAAAAAACGPAGIAHRTLVAEGDVAFSILDTAESLGCDQIVVARPVLSAWRNLFAAPVVRQLESLGRDVPLVLVSFAGIAQESAR